MKKVIGCWLEILLFIVFCIFVVVGCRVFILNTQEYESVNTVETTIQPTVSSTVSPTPNQTPSDVPTVNSTKNVEPQQVNETQTSRTFKLTAYCPCSICCGSYSNGITATGTVATAGRTIAVDPNVIPYGSEVIINGKTYVAEDCGGAISRNRIDIFFDSHQEALNFGVQYADVTLN